MKFIFSNVGPRSGAEKNTFLSKLLFSASDGGLRRALLGRFGTKIERVSRKKKTEWRDKWSTKTKVTERRKYEKLSRKRWGVATVADYFNPRFWSIAVDSLDPHHL